MNFLPHWAMFIAYGVIVLLVALFIAFKGIKRGVKFIILGLILIAASYLAYLGVQIAMWDTDEIIDFAIRWGPTVLFTLIIMTATFVGAKRGLRKSLILALHSVCACGVSVAFFFIVTSVKETDAGILNFINFFAGESGLQRLLGVDESLKSFKEVLAAAIATAFDPASDLGILIAENTAYLYTIVDMSFKLVFALLSLLIYFSLIFILYIIYHLCYSQRKYKRIKTAEFKNGTTDRSYKKRHIGGGVVGLVRGVAVGLLSLSFLGSVFFMVAGGVGKDGEDYDFGDDNVNYFYSIYRSIEGYGSQGVFKILNSLTDASATPYYLFAADLVFSGELNDAEFDVSGNISLRDEIGAFTGFARDAMELLMKYGAEEIQGVIGGEVTENAFDSVIEVMQREGFRTEFDALIDAFDAKTYIINLSMSLINSVIANIDEMSFSSSVGEDEKEFLKVVFKKGYLSPSIPDERAIIEQTGLDTVQGDKVRPYITVNKILNKQDIKILLNIVLSAIAGNETGDTVTLIQRLVSEFEKLTILNTERKEEINPVFGRVYCLCENKYLTAEGADGVTYEEIVTENIDWLDEINTLLDISGDALDLYGAVSEQEGETLDLIFYLFDEREGDYENNMRAYDRICNALSDSKVLGKVMTTSYLHGLITGALKGIAENIYLPENISYNNVYDEYGNLTEHGEVYNLFRGVKLLCNSENRVILDSLQGAGEEDIGEILSSVADAVKKTDDAGVSVADYIVSSAYLRSVVSVYLIETDGNTFYVPKVAREESAGERVNLIVEEELERLLYNMDKLADFVMPFVGDDGAWQDEVDDLLDDKEFNKLIRESKIFEGTVAQIIKVQLRTDAVKVPKLLSDDVENWLTTGKQGEVINILDALKVSSFKVSDVLVGGENSFGGEEVLDKISKMSGDDLEIFFRSSVLHYTVSAHLTDENFDVGGLTVVVPHGARTRLKNDVIDSLVKKNELTSALSTVAELNLSNDEEIGAIMVKIARNKDLITSSKILSASFAATIAADEQTANNLSLPRILREKGRKSELYYFDSTNPWTRETGALLDAFAELFDLDDESLNIDGDALKDAVSSIIGLLNDPSYVVQGESRLDVLYSSLTVRCKMTDEIDLSLSENDIVNAGILSALKEGEEVYKQLEFISLSEIFTALGLSDLDDLSRVDFTSIDVFRQIGGYIYDSGTTKSYIVAAAVSEQLLKNPDLIIPHTVTADMDGLPFVNPAETRLVLDSLTLLKEEYGFTNLGEWSQSGVRLPAGELREMMLSSAIFRAKITKQLSDNSNASLLAVGAEHGAKIENVGVNGGEFASVDKAQLDALLSGLEVCGIGGEIRVPEFNINFIRNCAIEDLEVMFESDIIRYRVCQTLADAGFDNRISFTKQSALNLSSRALQTVNSATPEQIKAAFN